MFNLISFNLYKCYIEIKLNLINSSVAVRQAMFLYYAPAKPSQGEIKNKLFSMNISRKEYFHLNHSKSKNNLYNRTEFK